MAILDISTPKFPSAIALVDDEDFEKVNIYKWTAHKPKNSIRIYAMRKPKIAGKQVTIQLHRFIMNAQQGQEIDHIDHNGLNCQKQNLRFCTRTQNCGNQRKTPKKRSSWAKGVSWHKQAKKWEAYINKNHKRYYLGLFENEIDAASAYDTKAKELFGHFANLNSLKRSKNAIYKF